MALADIGADYAGGIEAACVVDDNGRLADHTHVIERGRERYFARFFAEDDLDQHHALDWRKEMDADEMSWPFRHLRERADRQSRGVGAEDCPLPDRSFRRGDGAGLDLAVLEHRLDDEVAVPERAVVRGRPYAREQRIALGYGREPPVDLLGDQFRRMGLALVGRLLIAVDQR